ncbi:tRNA (cytidine(56)-2'-O)-methyltransferase [Halonotius terrestris]|uniref:tRNA (cytidine(56)-2'-O)-methyltransferase n=1 Tax=Halonotius terrestris TaxID=2487750 RepID=A0A8J8PBQ4_9EURY|nr:tRNA (cytidine(56)-2'-O)-methyltransferase [Halonotius terrestris]TQQ79857.1 tRNA (cytidine(56)-2'-O)-methyltransferase [Halonotius terrestris]
MQGPHEVVVLRYGHRPGRDDRMTTHVGLTARALGADRVLLPDNATQAAETIADITGRFGGPFAVEQSDSQQGIVRNWDGPIAHLTMYGQPIQDVESDVRSSLETGPLLVVVGGEKVPFELYEHADWNIGVTNQPHSEVAGLAVFLDRLFEGRELDEEWLDADRTVIPKETGKKVIPVEEAGAEVSDSEAGDDATTDTDA